MTGLAERLHHTGRGSRGIADAALATAARGPSVAGVKAWRLPGAWMAPSALREEADSLERLSYSGTCPAWRLCDTSRR